jgi:hypothetical protein
MATSLLQCSQHRVPLDGLQARPQRGLGRGWLRSWQRQRIVALRFTTMANRHLGQVACRDARARSQRGSARDHVAQLAHVARPVVLLHARERRVIDLPHSGALRQEMLRQRGDFFATFT